MTKAFLDTNILLEVVFSRKHKKAASVYYKQGLKDI